MSVRITDPVVSPGNQEHLDEAWEMKEQIRLEEGVFKQDKTFFEGAYARSKVYCYRDEDADELVGFAAARHDGYMLFLAVAPTHRGAGFGRRLVERIHAHHGAVACHVRATNQNAIGFYNHLGFDSHRVVDGYYDDGGDAYYMIRTGD